MKPPKFFKVIITAPDGRFGIKILEGGLDLNAAKWEAKRHRDLGMIVKIIPEKQTAGITKKCSGSVAKPSNF